MVLLREILASVLAEYGYESNDAATMAHELGLEYAGWGRWRNKKKMVVAKTVDGNLVKIPPTEMMKEPGDPEDPDLEHVGPKYKDMETLKKSGVGYEPGVGFYDAKTMKKMSLGDTVRRVVDFRKTSLWSNYDYIPGKGYYRLKDGPSLYAYEREKGRTATGIGV